MRVRRLGAGVALLFVSCSAPAPADPGPANRLEETIRLTVARIDARWITDLDGAARKLAGLGRDALPLMTLRLETAAPASRGVLDQAIRIVHATDPLFLVRPPDRPIQARLKTSTRLETHRHIFRDYPMHPAFDPRWDSADRVTVLLQNATYWEAARRFCDAFRLDLKDKGFEPADGRSFWSEPHGGSIVRARWLDADEATLAVRILLEPGTQPIDGSIVSLRLLDAKGGEVPATLWTEPSGASFMKTAGPRIVPGVGRADITPAPWAKDAPEPFTLSGEARAALPSKIEVEVWTAADWDDAPVRTIGACEIELTAFDSISLRYLGSGSPGGDPYRNHAWIFASDDLGRSANVSKFELTEAGAIQAGGQWPYAEPFTRLTVIRPTSAEEVDVPFKIKGIRRPAD